MASILVIEDDDRWCRLFRGVLKDMGHRPERAHNVETALAMLSRERFDLILLDLFLEEWEWDAITEQQLADIYRKARGAPIIVQTGKKIPERDAFYLRKYGVVEYLLKQSLEPEELKALIEKHLKGESDDKISTPIFHGKIKTNDFDVFLCHNHTDKPAVKVIANRLRDRGLLPWLDVEQLRPGMPWQPELERQIKTIKSAAVFVGKKGIGPWENQEQAAFLRQFVARKCPIIPVILHDAPRKPPELPLFLGGMTWVDFRELDPDPLDQLIWGITGQRGTV